MERYLMNEDAQWIIMMGFLVSFSFFFLAMVINQSTVVGQTTAESVSEFPKNDIRDTRNAVLWSVTNGTDVDWVQRDMSTISLSRRDAVVGFSTFTSIDHEFVYIHFNNGVTGYNENWTIL